MTALNGRKPRIGILGIMQDLYDDMIPRMPMRGLRPLRAVMSSVLLFKRHRWP